MSRRIPEIFIVGTMKGGTTILYDYLCTHPRVAPGKQKELHYFSLYPEKSLEWYVEQFPDRSEDCFSIDASPTYFDVATMPTVPAYIKKAAPNARIILIVRDPVDRAISHLQHLRRVSHKDLFAKIDPNEFLNRPLRRCYIQSDPSDFLLSQVLNFSIYDEKISNYFGVFGRESVLVLRNEDLSTDPQGVMRRVFEHCRLEWAPSKTFGIRRYESGSETLDVKANVRERLRSLLYPSYDRFLRRVGLTPIAMAR